MGRSQDPTDRFIIQITTKGPTDKNRRCRTGNQERPRPRFSHPEVGCFGNSGERKGTRPAKRGSRLSLQPPGRQGQGLERAAAPRGRREGRSRGVRRREPDRRDRPAGLKEPSAVRESFRLRDGFHRDRPAGTGLKSRIGLNGPRAAWGPVPPVGQHEKPSRHVPSPGIRRGYMREGLPVLGLMRRPPRRRRLNSPKCLNFL
jgi:hypothetical protein